MRIFWVPEPVAAPVAKAWVVVAERAEADRPVEAVVVGAGDLVEERGAGAAHRAGMAGQAERGQPPGV